MKIFLGQIYVKPRVTFPFSIRFQQWLGDALCERVGVSDQFCRNYGADFDLGFRLCARDDIDDPEIKGPTVFRRDKTVEFSIFLPHRALDYHDLTVVTSLVEQLLKSIVGVLKLAGLDAAKLTRDLQKLVAEFRETPDLLEPSET